jgi:hypothetical protein
MTASLTSVQAMVFFVKNYKNCLRSKQKEGLIMGPLTKKKYFKARQGERRSHLHLAQGAAWGQEEALLHQPDSFRHQLVVEIR